MEPEPRWRLLADENLHGGIVRGVLRRLPEVAFQRVQDAGLHGASDPAILAWAAQAERVVVSHDVATLADAAFDRIARGLPQPGVFLINARAPLGEAIDSLVLVLECSTPAEWTPRVTYLPLR